MKKIYFLLLATILIASCKPGSKTNNRSEGKPVITVTLEPLRYLTEAIAGDEFTGSQHGSQGHKSGNL